MNEKVLAHNDWVLNCNNNWWIVNLSMNCTQYFIYIYFATCRQLMFDDFSNPYKLFDDIWDQLNEIRLLCTITTWCQPVVGILFVMCVVLMKGGVFVAEVMVQRTLTENASQSWWFDCSQVCFCVFFLLYDTSQLWLSPLYVCLCFVLLVVCYSNGSDR